MSKCGVNKHLSQPVSECVQEVSPCVRESASIHTFHFENCVCLHVCWAGREHRSIVSRVCMFANGRVSGHQCEHVIYVP